MANYIRNKKVKKGKINDILKGFGKAAWSFISSIYKSEWNTLYSDKENRLFRQKFASKFTPNILKSNLSTNGVKHKNKGIEIIKISPLLSVRLPKKVLEKLRFFKILKKSNKIIKYIYFYFFLLLYFHSISFSYLKLRIGVSITIIYHMSQKNVNTYGY